MNCSLQISALECCLVLGTLPVTVPHEKVVGQMLAKMENHYVPL